MTEKTVLDAIRDAIAEELRRDERVFVLGEDVGRRGGVFRATQGLFPEFGEARLLDTPLAEAAIAGVALGAAMRGMRPIAEIQFADFIWPTVNQIIGEVAKVRYGTNGQLSAPMVLRTPYGGGVRGGLYHSQTPEAFFAHAAGLKVVCPATPYDAKGLLKAAIRDNDPVIFFEHKRTYRGIRGEVPDEDYVIPIGKADIKRKGDDITIVTYGLMVHYSLEAAQLVEKDGISIEVVDLRTVRPLDTTAILDSVKKTGKVIIVHEDNKTGGLGGEVAAIIAEEAFDYLDGPIMRIAGPDVPSIAFAPTLEAEYMPSPEKIAVAIRKLAAY
jgi:2-oxoisovalerate dehydrogenase E1 component beta subunit